MSSPEETKQAADLIERLLTDAQFRAEFRRDPITACEQFGLTDLAEELRGGSGAKALYTLELRQSMSSLAGVIMAAAAEGIGALELAGFGSSPDKRVAGVVNEALSRHSIKAISQAQMQAVEQQNGQGSAAVGDDVPADDASVDAGCGACGDPTGVCGHTPGAGCPHCGDAAGSCGHSAAACSTCGDHAGGCGHGVACSACGEASGSCGHTPGKGCPSCGDASGECGHGAAACGVCGDGSRTCGHSHADRKQAAGLLHGHAHPHSGHGHAHGGGHGHAHGGQSHAGHAHAAQAPESAKPQADTPPAQERPAAPAPAAEAPEGLHAASPVEAAPPSSGPASSTRESGVFAGVTDAKPAAGSTFEALPAVDAEPAAAAEPAPAEPPPEQPVEQQAAAAPLEVPAGEIAYPGDNAPKPEVAAWMAARAQAAGIPPELPVMAALVESRLSNVGFGHADSIGFFQMRTSIWDQGEYAGYGKDPEKQIKWFIDHAVHEKEKRLADGYTNFLDDPNKWGDWIADVERPAEEYRGRYQEQLEEAQALLKQAGGSAAPPAEAADVAGAEAGHDHAGHDHGPSLADAGGPAVTPSAELAALLENPNLELPDAARADLASGRVDPRMVSMLSALTKEHKVGLSVIITGHDQYTSGGSVSNHFVGRGIDIASVDGEIVRANSIASREVAEAIAELPESIRPSEVGTPWSINAEGFFTDGNHQDHLHIAYDDPAPAGFAPPASPVAAAAPTAAAEPVPAAAEPPGRESGVFAGVADAKPSSSPTVGAMPAVEQPAAAAVVDAVAPPAGPVPGAAFAPIDPADMANTNAGGKLHDSEFNVPDAEGAPGAGGNLHAGYDLFARAGAPVRSPVAGTIVEVKASRGNSGQIFGGVVKVQGADGRVWVFRHVDPKGVVEGGKIEAGQEIAAVTEWAGGAHHAHIELWKTLEGGYNVSNMEDPYAEFQKAYAGSGTELPPDVHQQGSGGDEHAGHDHGGGGQLAEAGPAVAPSAELEALLANPNLELPDAARADLASGKVDPRLVSMLTELTKEHKVGLSVIITGHDKFSSSGSVSNHFVGRGLDIASVDGEIVRPNSIASREVAEAIADLPESIRPTEVGTPWSINADGFFTDGNHQDHLHIAYDGEAPASFASPVTPAAAPTPVAETPAAAAPEPEPQPAAAEARESGVFAQVDEPAQGSNGGNTVQFMQAVKAEAKDKLQAAPEADLEPAKLDAPVEAAAAVDGYPGDQAPKEQLAAWMAARARAAGIPPELPVMAALVESRLSNVNFGDADSIGFFQMRTSIWDQGEYAGYGSDPEKQIKWFIDHAVHEKQKRLADGYTNFLEDETKWGDWVADIERPAEEYRGRYQERLAEARALLGKSGA